MPHTSARLCAKFEDCNAAHDLLVVAGYWFYPLTWNYGPPAGRAMTLDEADALTYLVEEWDWGGLRRSNLSPSEAP